MIALLWARGLLRRRLGRLLGVGTAVALVVGLVAALGSFVVFARSEVSRKAIEGVDVDWQIQLAPDAQPPAALSALSPIPGVRASEPVGYGDATSLRSSSGRTVQTTGAGKVVGLPASYASTFDAEIRYLVGAHDGVLLTQQTASNLHAGPGSVVVVQIRGRPDATLRVDGVIDMPNADSFFQLVGARSGSGPQAPPDDVVVVPLAQWRHLFDPAAGNGVVQMHVKLARHLPRDPGAAFALLSGERKNYEVRMSGAATVGDNLSARLDSARKDATYGQLLFLFLGLPGIVLGMAFAAIGAAAGTERRRAEQALLRARGAGPGTLVRVALSEASLVWLIGAPIGLVAGAIGAGALWHVGLQRTWPWMATALGVGLFTTAVAVLRPALRDAREMTVGGARRSVAAAARRGPRVAASAPWVVAAVAGVIVWYTTRESYAVVVAPEGVPSITVSYLSLAGPVLAWIAGAWVIAADTSAALARGRPVLRRLVRPLAGSLSGLVAAWISRLRSVTVRAGLLLAIAVAFAISAAVFDASFSAQSRVDAELTNGADVTAFAPPGVALQSNAGKIAQVPGVAAVEPMQHRFAYVGNDLQDLYGVHARSIGRATAISDAYFGGGHSTAKLSSLDRHSDGIYVSDETVKDFVLRPGDEIKLRLLDAAAHAYVPVTFHLLGVVREFPTAPTDSFLVANASYVAKMTHSDAAEILLVRASGSPPAVAARVRSALGPAPGATVRDIATQRKITATGLVALDLRGLSALNLGFGLLGALWAVGLLTSVGFSERRRQFAILRAVGAKARHVAAFVVAEAGSVVVVGIVAGLVLGGTIAWILVRVLHGVFDPPPAHPVVPWAYLGALLAAIVVGAGAAITFVLRYSARLGPQALRDLTS